ncbi:Predicted xylanase/chitin deacetylase [Candidatus Terasakiella magnetica]|nr:Predicted xylanase/chitin deacetylase [Candidatus Terasakiella magnetica]
MSPRDALAPLALTVWRLAARLRTVPKGAVRLVILHDVAPDRVEAFRTLVDHLGRTCGLIGPREAADRLAGRCDPDGRAPALLTFDDGFRSNLEATWAVLDPLGVKALYFICPGLMDLPLSQQRAAIAAHVHAGKRREADLPPHLALMSWDEVRQLAASGHAIGCHSLTHDRLAGLDRPELERQVGEAKGRMEAMLGASTPWFAFPFGDLASIDAPALSVIARHFPLCRSGIRGLAHNGTSPLALPAESVDLDATAAWQALAAEGALAPLYRGRLARLEHLAQPGRTTP